MRQGLIYAKIFPLHVLLPPPDEKPDLSLRSNGKTKNWSVVNFKNRHVLNEL